MAGLTQFKDFSYKSITLPSPAKFTNAPDAPKSIEFPEILLQLPKSRTAYKGVAQFDPGAPWYLSLKLELDTLKVLEELDDYLVKYISDNSKALIGEETDVAAVRKYCYNPIVTKGKKEGYENTRTLKMKLNMKDGPYATKAFDHTKTKIPTDSIKGNDSVVCLIAIDRVYYMMNKFGVSFKLKQVVKYPSVDMDDCAVEIDVESDSA
jgi:hypothetical protein